MIIILISTSDGQDQPRSLNRTLFIITALRLLFTHAGRGRDSSVPASGACEKESTTPDRCDSYPLETTETVISVPAWLCKLVALSMAALNFIAAFSYLTIQHAPVGRGQPTGNWCGEKLDYARGQRHTIQEKSTTISRTRKNRPGTLSNLDTVMEVDPGSAPCLSLLMHLGHAFFFFLSNCFGRGSGKNSYDTRQ